MVDGAVRLRREGALGEKYGIIDYGIIDSPTCNDFPALLFAGVDGIPTMISRT
jgi:hypothetical protein